MVVFGHKPATKRCIIHCWGNTLPMMIYITILIKLEHFHKFSTIPTISVEFLNKAVTAAMDRAIFISSCAICWPIHTFFIIFFCIFMLLLIFLRKTKLAKRIMCKDFQIYKVCRSTTYYLLSDFFLTYVCCLWCAHILAINLYNSFRFKEMFKQYLLPMSQIFLKIVLHTALQAYKTLQ